MRSVSILMVLAIFFFACAGDSTNGAASANSTAGENGESTEETNQEPTELETKKWNLHSLEFEGKTFRTTSKEVEYSMVFTNQARINGFGGCNPFSAEYSISPSNTQISFSNLRSTKKVCSGTSSIERRYFALLREAKSYEYNKVELVFNCGNKGKLIFTTNI